MTQSLALKMLLVLFLSLGSGATSFASGFSNYNSVLIGDMAAGMGGAFTGLSGDPSACAFYNPATLARMRGTSLSATANVYHKYDTVYGGQRDLLGAGGRINRGSFRSIPASAGSVAAFGPFAVGLSVIVPDYDFFSGPIARPTGQDVNLNVLDESLWIGGNFAVNLSQESSVGLTIYYTSRFFQKQLVDNTRPGNGFANLVTEEKTYSNNSIIYMLGYFHQFNPNWSAGTSLRFPSIEVHGRGTYFLSEINTQSQSTPTTTIESEIPSESRVPLKASVGVAYRQPSRHTFSLDISYYGREKYYDLDNPRARDLIEHVDTWNAALGAEFYLKHWLRWRAGVFSNVSSHPEIREFSERRSDHIDMWGISSNFGVFTSDKVSFTVGGYFTGGTGHAVERLNGNLVKIDKSQQVFALLIGSAYFF